MQGDVRDGTWTGRDDTISLGSAPRHRVRKGSTARRLPTGVTITEVAKVERLIRGEGFHCHFQPVWSLREGRPVGFEALSRSHGSSLIAPYRMFEVAGALGQAVDLELVAIARALEALPELPHRCYLSLNVSPGALLDARIHKLLDDCERCNRLMIEITEHEKVEDYARIREALLPLRERGISLATDDAGAGHANLSHVLELRPDVLKLDRFVVNGLHKDAGRFAMVRAFKQFADDTSTVLIAEGVEEQEEVAALRALGVDHIQGFVISPAVALREAVRMETGPNGHA